MVESLCPICPWGKELGNPVALDRLLRFMALLDAGCPVGRHELRNHEWVWLGALRAERSQILREKVNRHGEPV